MENDLNIDISSFSETKIDIDSQEFFCKNRYVKFNGIIPRQITTFKKHGKLLCNFFEGRRLSYIFIFYPMYSCGFGRNRHLWIYPGTHPLLFSIGTDL